MMGSTYRGYGRLAELTEVTVGQVAHGMAGRAHLLVHLVATPKQFEKK